MPTDKRQRQKERAQAERAARAAAAARARRRRNIILGAVAIAAVFLFAFLYSTLRGGDDAVEVETPGAPPAETIEPGDDEEGATPTTIERGDPVDPECPPEDGAAERLTQFTEAPPMCLDDDATYEAVFETDAGDIRVALDTDDTPATVNNFVFLARWGYYDGTAMFRSNTGIDIIQGGAPHTQDNADPGPGYTIEDEGGPYGYQTGDLVMARTAAPDSAGAQYFFSTGPDTQLLNDQGTYVVFGRVIEGLDVLETIMATHVDTGASPGEGAPDPKPIVNTVRIVQS
jgi:cyclophilin family peptidyl-prolyl cis-trans isomerase